MTVDVTRPAIDPQVVGQHLERASELLNEHKAGGLVLFRDSNILGFCGVPLAPSDRLACGLVNADGRVAFVVPAFEAEIADGLPAGSELIAWEEHEDPYAAAAEAARRLGLTTANIFLDGYTWVDTQARFRGALPRAQFELDPGIIDSVRIKKSPEEIEAIRAACEDTGRIYPLIARRLQAGMSELDLSREVMARLRKDGVSPCCDLIQGGTSAAIPHQPSGQRIFRDGEAVIVDFVAKRDSYHGDMTRTFAIGRPESEVKRAYTIVRRAQRAAIEAARPGVTCEAVDRAARAVIEEAGFGEYFVHRLGHGIGLDGHEPPYLVKGNKRRLEPGMCATVEPGIYIPGEFGIRIEDVITITQDGCSVLSTSVPTDVSDAFK